ncbi:hypothetical protein GALMADRAFT_234689 [Galerina marginata CBS 339.88]|uniref:Exonuclease V n=1 Tax=Galerina marginata (strain CBS 339.88) TaxID=685588 RepID=A0A067U073_GALM3|nr:hypothetical protein GALMADRAFT_234689 [Galerina marginata CBS 339.88]
MSDYDSDNSYPGLNLSQFTSEDFAQIDAAVASRIQTEEGPGVAEVSFQSEINGLNLSRLTPQQLFELDAAVSIANGEIIEKADLSFRSDGFELNLRTISSEEFERLDEEPRKAMEIDGGPSILIELDDLAGSPVGLMADLENASGERPWNRKSPLEQFRSYVPLSVTDLVSPAWCEVQYDYGLRGKRSRPIGKRPKSFRSSTGKKISPEITVAKKNDVRTRQGLAVHKELEREIKFEELEVEITTDETRWALRLVNMLACLKSMLAGLTREMPVFGILHGEVVVGIMDEVIKVEADPTPKTKSPKRPSDEYRSKVVAKRARTDTLVSPSPQSRIDSFFESPTKSKRKTEPEPRDSEPIESARPSETRPGYILRIKDNKTRKYPSLPSESDMYSGRLQLMVYRRLLSALLTTNPPYDFTLLWEKLGIDSSGIFPTKFLVQAQLVQDDSDFQTTCLNDLVAMWHQTVKESDILGVDPNLELVYRLRPTADRKGKGKAVAVRHEYTTGDEERDLAMAIAASLNDSGAGQEGTAIADVAEWNSKTSIPTPDLLDSRDSSMPLNPTGSSELPGCSMPGEDTFTDRKGKNKEIESLDELGIRRFKIIGTKNFSHNDEELDEYLTHVLKWWRGERKPEGVPLDRAHRCSTCEYANDCEWRAERALEFLFNKRKRSPLPILPQ